LSRLTHRAIARAPHVITPPNIEHDPDVLQSFLSDAAHVPGGTAAGVVFPANVDEVAAIVAAAKHILPVGAQSSLTGGATPRGDIVLSTRRLSHIGEPEEGAVRVGAGVPLSELHRFLAAHDLFYPPAPTFDGAFVGGTIATNAAGAATFKYGVTRHWLNGLTVVLADGSILDLKRGDVRASEEGLFEIETIGRGLVPVRIPTYKVPTHLPKLSAGYFTMAGLDLIDLFCGSEGTLGVIVEATLAVTRRPLRCMALVTCESEEQAVKLAGALRSFPRSGHGVLDVAAIEYIDSKSLQLLDDATFARAGIGRPAPSATVLLVQMEMKDQLGTALEEFENVLRAHRIENDPVVALPDDERTAQRLFELRESVPAAVNARVGAAKARVHPDIQKVAGDFIVPSPSIAKALALYRDAFEYRGLEYAIWGHISDGNLHPNLIPRSLDDVEKGRDALLEMARGVIALGGAPLAEHGVGRNPLKQLFLRELYGDKGIEEMRAVKRALDPEGKFAAGVLFPP
jgi:D-lactate dehydrogenase (cytochrome)